jgi:phosphoribosylaminoimidazolecarboxamide formyltransferase / IMP cyclohydrolase
MKKRALLSVSDKSGIDSLASALVGMGYEIISTGGTAKTLAEAGIAVTPVDHVTQFPECFGGRVKTMHPLLMGGILYKRNDPVQVKEAADLRIDPIDIIVVNLYPFAQTVAKLKASGKTGEDMMAEMIEQIDIGGPTLLRSAAKNHDALIALCDTADYSRVIDALKSGGTTLELRRELAAKVFVHTATYDALIAEELSGGKHTGVMMTGGRQLRYGENPHQWGRFYAISRSGEPSSNNTWKLLQGKELSYLNLLDADGAWRMVQDFSEPTAVFVKHANPSGIASDKDIATAFQKAYDSDRLSAFGVIIALNRTCTAETVKKLVDQKIFTELILAPGFDAEALEMLKAKPNIRVLDMDGTRFSEDIVYRSAFGGMLVQDDDTRTLTEADLKCVTKKKPTKEQIADLLFAWKVVKHAKSNAIVFAKDQVTVGIGCGQTSRVDATWIAAKRAGEKAKGAVVASDAFFPFPDSLEEAAKHGIVAVVQPGGSIRDEEVIKKADELGIAMVVTGVRGFRH